MELCAPDMLLFSGMKSYHEFVLELQGPAYYVRGPVQLSRLEAFAFIIPQPVSADRVVTYGRPFPEEPPTIVRVLDSMRKAAPAWVQVARHKLKPPNPSRGPRSQPWYRGKTCCICGIQGWPLPVFCGLCIDCNLTLVGGWNASTKPRIGHCLPLTVRCPIRLCLSR